MPSKRPTLTPISFAKRQSTKTSETTASPKDPPSTCKTMREAAKKVAGLREEIDRLAKRLKYIDEMKRKAEVKTKMLLEADRNREELRTLGRRRRRNESGKDQGATDDSGDGDSGPEQRCLLDRGDDAQQQSLVKRQTSNMSSYHSTKSAPVPKRSPKDEQPGTRRSNDVFNFSSKTSSRIPDNKGLGCLRKQSSVASLNGGLYGQSTKDKLAEKLLSPASSDADELHRVLAELKAEETRKLDEYLRIVSCKSSVELMVKEKVFSVKG